MARNFQDDAYAEHARHLAIKQWLSARAEAIRQSVSAYDVLSRNGVSLRKSGQQQEQISCPFHGSDTNPSARYYPENTKGYSGVWCFVCREKGWDAIGLWKKFSGETKWSRVLFSMERAFGLPTPEFDAPPPEEEYDPLLAEVESLLDACENRLIRERDRFDMGSYLKLGSILDRIRSQVDKGGLPLPKAREVLAQVLTKIGEKVRAPKTDSANP